MLPINNLNAGNLDAVIKRRISFPIMHRLFVHARFYIILGGLVVASMGLSNVVEHLGYPIFGGVLFCISLVADICGLISLLRPCHCGKEFLLTSGTKKIINRLHTKQIIIRGLLGTIIVLPFVFLVLSTAGNSSATLIESFMLLVFGFIGILYSLRIRAIIPIEQHHRVIELKGATVEELSELFEYYLDLGYLDEAERVSKLSISLAQGMNIDLER